jgi:hypothetical protein
MPRAETTITSTDPGGRLHLRHGRPEQPEVAISKRGTQWRDKEDDSPRAAGAAGRAPRRSGPLFAGNVGLGLVVEAGRSRFEQADRHPRPALGDSRLSHKGAQS